MTGGPEEGDIHRMSIQKQTLILLVFIQSLFNDPLLNHHVLTSTLCLYDVPRTSSLLDQIGRRVGRRCGPSYGPRRLARRLRDRHQRPRRLAYTNSQRCWLPLTYLRIRNCFDIRCRRLNSSKKVRAISGSSKMTMFSTFVTADSVTLNEPLMTQTGSRASSRPIKNL